MVPWPTNCSKVNIVFEWVDFVCNKPQEINWNRRPIWGHPCNENSGLWTKSERVIIWYEGNKKKWVTAFYSTIRWIGFVVPKFQLHMDHNPSLLCWTLILYFSITVYRWRAQNPSWYCSGFPLFFFEKYKWKGYIIFSSQILGGKLLLIII